MSHHVATLQSAFDKTASVLDFAGLAQKRVPVFRKTTVLGGYHEGCIECYPTGILIACDSP